MKSLIATLFILGTFSALAEVEESSKEVCFNKAYQEITNSKSVLKKLESLSPNRPGELEQITQIMVHTTELAMAVCE